MSKIILKPGKEGSVIHRHPWIFESAIAHLNGRAKLGDTVDVFAHDNRALGRAAWSPHSQIRARMWTFDPNEIVDHAFFKRRVTTALALRRDLPELRHQQGLRIIQGEADGLPGVVADLYGDTVVVQLSSAGADKWRDAIVAALAQATGCKRVYERSDLDVRRLEGLESRTGFLYGEAPETIPSAPLVIEENGVRLEVDIQNGHKTGFYLDQRDNRLLARQLAGGRSVLNCFCYTGGFSLQALAGEASQVISIDSSQPALESAQRNLALNPKLDAKRAEWRDADVFEELRLLKKSGARFDLIILDPPKFAPSAAHAERAARAYKDINLLGFRLLNPGGLLMTYSCSGGIDAAAFHQIVASAAIDAKVDARVLRRLAAAPDHPVSLAFPEGEYLKGLLCQIS